MTIIAHARIAERIDQSPTEQFSRLAPLPPASIAKQLHWAAVDLKSTPTGTCPAWCAHHIDTSPEPSTFHTSATLLLAVGVGAGQPGTVEIDAEWIQDADPTDSGPMLVRLNGDLLTAAEARQVAAALVAHADRIDAPAPTVSRSPFRTAIIAFRLGRQVEQLRRAGRRRGAK
jgi:hypothetical protein